MKHLGPETLGALHDGALDAAARAEAERHLAACAECRDALAAIAAADERLAAALRHDPGEAYFESFADRVTARLDRDAGAAPATAPARRSVWAWLGSPRGLALAGGVAAIAVVSVLVLRQGREAGVPASTSPLAARSEQTAPPAPEAPRSVDGGRALQAPPPATATQPAPTRAHAAPSAGAPAAQARDERSPAPPAAAPLARAIPVVPNAREDIPTGTAVSDRELMRESRAEAAAPAPQAQKATPEVIVRTLKSRAAGKLENTTGGAAQGFAAAPQDIAQPHIVTRPSSRIAWPVSLLPEVQTADSLTAMAGRIDTPYAHAQAWQAWRSVRELTDSGSDADRYSAGRIAEERFALWRLRPIPAGMTAAREAIQEVIQLTPAGPERARWQRLLEQVK